MTKFNLTAEETQDLKQDLLAFVKRVAQSTDYDPDRIRILPDIVRLLLDEMPSWCQELPNGDFVA